MRHSISVLDIGGSWLSRSQLTWPMWDKAEWSCVSADAKWFFPCTSNLHLNVNWRQTHSEHHYLCSSFLSLRLLTSAVFLFWLPANSTIFNHKINKNGVSDKAVDFLSRLNVLMSWLYSHCLGPLTLQFSEWCEQSVPGMWELELATAPVVPLYGQHLHQTGGGPRYKDHCWYLRR